MGFARADAHNRFAVCYRYNVDKPLQPEYSKFGAFADDEDAAWERLGGVELEQPIKEGWVRLLRVGYLVALARERGILRRRQDMPEEAYISLADLQQARTGKVFLERFEVEPRSCEWLPIIVVSYPWLQPSHPDPFGETLQALAKACRFFPEDHGILIDFTALPQAKRSREEEDIFRHGLRSLNLFYSHPHTVVFKATELPAGYPNGLYHYHLPAGMKAVVQYRERGWCFAEAAMSALAKDCALTWDLSKLGEAVNLVRDITYCKGVRSPPLDPQEFNKQLAAKTFAQPNADRDKVQQLYQGAFDMRVQKARSLTFSMLDWGDCEVKQLFKALRINDSLATLNLSDNQLKDSGAQVVAEALRDGACLRQLDLSCNGVRSAGAVALAGALRYNKALQQLSLARNGIGDTGAAALGEALRCSTGSALRGLDLQANGIGPSGAQALGEGVWGNNCLQRLDLRGNHVKDVGAAALAEALRSSSALRELGLAANGITCQGFFAVSSALHSNTTLRQLDLSRNPAKDAGALALAEALRCNNVLQRLTLWQSSLGEESMAALEEACSDGMCGVEL